MDFLSLASLPRQARPLLIDIAGDLPRTPERGESIGLELQHYRVFCTPG